MLMFMSNVMEYYEVQIGNDIRSMVTGEREKHIDLVKGWNY